MKDAPGWLLVFRGLLFARTPLAALGRGLQEQQQQEQEKQPPARQAGEAAGGAPILSSGAVRRCWRAQSPCRREAHAGFGLKGFHQREELTQCQFLPLECTGMALLASAAPGEPDSFIPSLALLCLFPEVWASPQTSFPSPLGQDPEGAGGVQSLAAAPCINLIHFPRENSKPLSCARG